MYTRLSKKLSRMPARFPQFSFSFPKLARLHIDALKREVEFNGKMEAFNFRSRVVNSMLLGECSYFSKLKALSWRRQGMLNICARDMLLSGCSRAEEVCIRCG